MTPNSGETSGSFSLRPARESEAGVIKEMVRRELINPTGLDWRRFVVAVSPAGEVIGCGQVKPHRDGAQELASIVVVPAWRGEGVARAIIERLLRDHTGELYLMCRSGLAPLYEKFGFFEISSGEMPRYFRRVSRLAGLVQGLAKGGERLVVMKREAAGPS